jgi:hypothetical protein
MSKCKECFYFEPGADMKKKPLAWGHCNFFIKAEIPVRFPIYAITLRSEMNRKGYVSPNQEYCETFKECLS